MATAKQLPSGSWRIRVYDRETGKYISFTSKLKGKAGKNEAEFMAKQWQTGRKRSKQIELTLDGAIDKYISSKENILSPTTIDKYRNIKKNQLSKSFLLLKCSHITQIDVQNEVNRLAGIYSPKTVHNAHGLISAVLRQYVPSLNLHTTLPQKQRKIKELPTAEQIIEWFKGSDIELVVLLGLWQGFRVSEIRGLRKSDFKNGILTINQVIVTVGKENITKSMAKTSKSNRKLEVPEMIQRLVDEVNSEYITTINGVNIYKKFKRIVRKNGYPDITFHDLRHLNASIMLALGVPDKYAMERGGWSTTSTLKNVYQQTMSAERQRFDKVIDGYFEKIIQEKNEENEKI